jgi:hypothetical protein
MPDFELTLPDGTRVGGTAPEGVTQEQIIAAYQKQYAQQKDDYMRLLGQGAKKGIMGFLASGAGSEPQMPGETEEQFGARSALPGQVEQQYPRPKSLGGRMIMGAAEGAANPANLLLGPAAPLAVGGRIAAGAAGGAGAELAGALTKDNPVARLIGGAAGATIPRAAVGAAGRIAGAVAPRADALPASVPPARAAAIQQLRQQGIEPTAADVLGRSYVRQLERQGDRVFGGDSYRRIKTEVAEQYTQAASRSIGEDAPRLTPDVIRRARIRIGRVFERVANNLPIRRDRALGDELVAIERQVFDFGHTDEVHRRISALINHINNNFIDSVRRGRPYAQMDGRTYQAITTHGAELQRAIDGVDTNIAYFAGRIRSALDDAMERSVTKAVNDAQSFGRPGGPAQIRARELQQNLQDLRQAREQWYNMRVLSQAVAGPGEQAAQGLVLPERLRSAMTSGIDNKLSWASERSSLGNLAAAGAAVLEPYRPSGWEGWAVAHGIATGFGLLTGGPTGAVVAGTLGPGTIGRLANSDVAQNFLKNQRATSLLNQLEDWNQIMGRGAAIGAASSARPGPPTPPGMLRGARRPQPGDRDREREAAELQPSPF